MALRHYTDDAGRQGIERLGLITPSADGRVYLTPDSYEWGRAAREGLSLDRTPTGYFAIPEERLRAASPPRRVHPRRGLPGGGFETFVTHPIDARELVWTAVRP